MALTKISTGGVKDDGITSAKIADGNVQQGHLDSECINESKIQISNDGTNGQFLQKQSGNAGGLTWAAAGGASSIADDSVTEVKLDIHADPSGTDKFLAYTSNGMEWAVPTDTNTQLSTEQVQDIVGAMFTGNTETNITATYEDSDGTIDLVSTDTNTQLSTEEVQDIVGAMFTGNTETGATITYEDSDGTIDVVAEPEGTAIKSTGESGGTKFLREDGDGSCSWQTVSSVPTTITVADESSDTTCFPLFVTDATGDLAPKTRSGGLYFNSSTKHLTCDGGVSDGAGNIKRAVPISETGNVTLTASYANRTVYTSASGASVTVPTGVFSAGDMVTIINNSGSDQTITCSAITMYLANDTTAKTSLTLAGRGMCTMIWVTNAIAYISGAGLS